MVRCPIAISNPPWLAMTGPMEMLEYLSYAYLFNNKELKRMVTGEKYVAVGTYAGTSLLCSS